MDRDWTIGLEGGTEKEKEKRYLLIGPRSFYLKLAITWFVLYRLFPGRGVVGGGLLPFPAYRSERTIPACSSPTTMTTGCWRYCSLTAAAATRSPVDFASTLLQFCGRLGLPDVVRWILRGESRLLFIVLKADLIYLPFVATFSGYHYRTGFLPCGSRPHPPHTVAALFCYCCLAVTVLPLLLIHSPTLPLLVLPKHCDVPA